jgi:hypothetical protein
MERRNSKSQAGGGEQPAFRLFSTAKRRTLPMYVEARII